MTRDEIYEHLAKVYLGKRESVAEEKKKKAVNQSWLVINIVITAVILISTVYGFTAFLTRRAGLNNQIFYELNNNLVKVAYNLNDPFPSTKRSRSRSRVRMFLNSANCIYPYAV